MIVPLYKRSSFWNLIVQSLQIGLGSFQAIALSNEQSIEKYNIILAGFQALLGIIGLWTRDTNRNNIIDIAEETTETTIVVESKGPVTVKDVTTEPEKP
jgi:hypothetical protein